MQWFELHPCANKLKQVFALYADGLTTVKTAITVSLIHTYLLGSGFRACQNDIHCMGITHYEAHIHHRADTPFMPTGNLATPINLSMILDCGEGTHITEEANVRTTAPPYHLISIITTTIIIDICQLLLFHACCFFDFHDAKEQYTEVLCLLETRPGSGHIFMSLCGSQTIKCPSAGGNCEKG